MAVRIYSLAKELKLDSKELVDLCARAGIQDKGSALASLSDDEVARVKEFIAGKSKPPERPTSPAARSPAKASGVLKREDYVAPTGAVGRSRPKDLSAAKPTPKPAPLSRPVRPVAESGDRSAAKDQGGDGSPPLRVPPS